MTEPFTLACEAIKRNPELVAAMLTDESIYALAKQRQRVDQGPKTAHTPELEARLFQQAIKLNPRFA
jgi:hypothetical protein